MMRKVGVPRTFLFAGALVVCLLGATLLGGQTVPPDRPQVAEEFFKDVRLLRGIPVDEFLGTMSFFSASLGLNCSDCHVEESLGNWERYADDHELKQTARRMILMTAAINRANFDGQQMVTCNTCHRGVDRPNALPSLAALYSEPPPAEPGGIIEQAPWGPSADGILERYLEAIGGSERLVSLTSLAAEGTYIGFADLDEHPLEIFATAEGQRTAIVRRSSGDVITTYDGRAAWRAAPPVDQPVPLLVLTGHELEGVRIETELMFPGRIKQALRDWRAGFPTTLDDDRDVDLIQGTSAGGVVVTLLFDSESGLLVRLVRLATSPVGNNPTQIDYEDYREVAGIKMPFRWTVTWLGGRSTFQLNDVRLNVPIEPAMFARPTQ